MGNRIQIRTVEPGGLMKEQRNLVRWAALTVVFIGLTSCIAGAALIGLAATLALIFVLDSDFWARGLGALAAVLVALRVVYAIVLRRKKKRKE